MPVNVSDSPHSASDVTFRFLRSMTGPVRTIGASVGSVVSKQDYGRIRGRSEGGKLLVKSRSHLCSGGGEVLRVEC